jgi:HK97 family phage prohead protease
MNDVEIRAVSLPPTVSERGLRGYAAVFGAKSHPLMGPRGEFTETISPKAFNKAKGDGWVNVVCRWEHRSEPEYLLSSTDSGTLRLDTDEYGLLYDSDLIPSRRDVAEMVAAKMITGSSFCFDMPTDEWTLHSGGTLLRTIHSCRLVDVAPCRQPAYPDATINARALDSFAKFVGADPVEVRKRLDETGDLRGFLTVTAPKPGFKEPVGIKTRIEEIRKSGRLALMETLAAKDNPPDPTTFQTPPKLGAAALAETEAMKPNWGPDAYMRTLAEEMSELRTSVADAMLQLTMARETPVYCTSEEPSPVTETAESITGLAASYRTLTGRDPWEALRMLDDMKPVERLPYTTAREMGFDEYF